VTRPSPDVNRIALDGYVLDGTERLEERYGRHRSTLWA
jgi:hypothetical protein